MTQAPIYHVGQSIALNPGEFPAASRGPYEIIRLLPSDGRNLSYRIQHHVDRHERVVRQSDILGETAPALMRPLPPSLRKSSVGTATTRRSTLPKI